MSSCLPRQDAGFSLLEILLVLIIVTMLMGVVVPKVGQGWSKLENKVFMNTFVRELNAARFQAMRQGKPMHFVIRTDQRTFGPAPGTGNEIPDDVDIFAEGLQEIEEGQGFFVTYYPDGSLSKTRIDVIFNEKRLFEIHIDSITGAVHVAKGE